MKKTVIAVLVVALVCIGVFVVSRTQKDNLYTETKQQLEAAQDTETISKSIHEIMDKLEELGDYKDSKLLLQEAQLKLFRNYLALGNPGTALEYLHQPEVLESYPERKELLAEACIMQADIYITEGNIDKAIKILEPYKRDSQDVAKKLSEARIMQADICLAEGEIDEAIALLEACNTNLPDVAEKLSIARFLHAQQLEAEGRYEEARQAYLNSKHELGLKKAYSVQYAHMLTKDKIAVGNKSKVFALTKDGTVLYAGSGKNPVADWTDIVAIDDGHGQHLIGLKSDGTVVAWGDNSSGELDVSDWRDIVAISSSGSLTVGLKADGTVVATGYISGDEFGGLSDVIAICAGSLRAYAITSDGTTYRIVKRLDSGEIAIYTPTNWPKLSSIAESGDNCYVGITLDGKVRLWSDAYRDYYYGDRHEEGRYYKLDLDKRYSGYALHESDINHNHWNDIVCVDIDDDHCIAVRNDGTVYLGCNSQNTSPSEEVATWTNIAAIVTADGWRTLGLLKDGTFVYSNLYEEVEDVISKWPPITCGGKGLQ